ncbi:TPA: hypothetical protein IFA33_000706 [Escherichia coli]|nr:hypothetical protein [Escherichia coli O157]NES48055.1 hypothetical protein [Escherichia coli]QDF14048.1 hypothetical protein vBEcoMphAPEC6_gp425c [Escherichia phage vB_EcoM_phAPEC6]MED6971197.1 hypothetical protein [Escherichia coli O157]TZC62015.1 hypothetical protein E0J33_13710 [Escherichia coli]
MSKDLSFSNAQKIAKDIIRVYKFLANVTEDFLIDKNKVIKRNGYLSFMDGLLYSSDESTCSIRVLDEVPSGDFISYHFPSSDNFKYYNHLLINEAFDTIVINTEEEFFQYSTVYPERIVFSSVILTALKNELNSDSDHFYLDLNNVDCIIEYLEKNGL